FFFQAEDGIRDKLVTGVQTCALPICIPDTVGIMCPKGMYNLIKTVYENIDRSKSSLDVHCHNDIGLALANSLAGCEAGAEQIHRSEERRVGKEWRARWSQEQQKKNKK